MIDGCITTFTGKEINIINLDIDKIDIQDIAHSLSNQCRFAGHCNKFYSVAEHSVICANFLWTKGLDKNTILWGLLHDASECYLSDVCRPIKALMPQYYEMELKIQLRIAEKFNLSKDIPKEVKMIDNEMLIFEAKQLGFTNTNTEYWFQVKNEIITNNFKLACLPPILAKEYFLSTYNNILNL